MNQKQCFEILEKRLAQHRFAQYCSFRLQGVDCGRVTLSLLVERRHTNGVGAVHGGCMASLTGVAARMAARSMGANPEIQSISTDYIKNVPLGDRIIARAQVVHRGHSTVVAQSDIFSSQGVKLCTSLVSMNVIDEDPDIPPQW